MFFLTLIKLLFNHHNPIIAIARINIKSLETIIVITSDNVFKF